MRPAPSATIIRIDPVYQPLWRDDHTIQFGVDRRAEVPLTEHWQEPLLRELQRGIRPAAFDVVAHGLGAPRAHARAFLQALRPVIRKVPGTAPEVSVYALRSGDHGCVLWARDALIDLGFDLSPSPAARPAAEIVIVRGAADARSFAGHLAADRTHLPVAIDRGGATVGPVVIPGHTPCLSCRDAQETARDAAWPLLHAQLIGQVGPRISGSRVVAATTAAAGLLRANRPGRDIVRISVDGRRRRWRIGFDDRCRCRERQLRSQRGTATAPAGRVRASAPTRSTVFAQPA